MAQDMPDGEGKELFVRYGMDPERWKATQRDRCPYNMPLAWIVGVPLVTPLVFLVLDLAIVDKDYTCLRIIS